MTTSTMNEHYKAPSSKEWHGRTDSLPGERFFQYIQCVDLAQTNALKPGFALLGFSCDTGVERNLGQPGAKEGPAAIRHALGNLSLPASLKQPLYDCGDILCVDNDLESAQKALGNSVSQLLKLGMRPLLLGGGHEIAWGHYQGIAAAKPKSKIGIINFDAHYDLRPPLPEQRGSSGTPFNQIALHREQAGLDFDYLVLGIQPFANTPSLRQRAEDLKVNSISAQALMRDPDVKTVIENFINDKEFIYLTVCLDVFNAACAPGVSAPQPLGVFPQHVLPYLEQICHSGKVISMDIAECSPPLDQENKTARLAALLGASMLECCG